MTVVITGASSGIGLELSKRYAKKATKIYLLARREQELNILADSLRQNNHDLSVETMAVDVTDFSKLTEVSEYICRSGEKIDIFEWSDNISELIANALSPSIGVAVIPNETVKDGLIVVVPDNQLSLAIGKEGQNARLAAKLTGWKIDIKSESQAAEEAEQGAQEVGVAYEADED